MNIEIFTLCDSAYDYSGKLVIAGAFTALAFTGKDAPISLPDVAVVARIKMEKEEAGAHHIRLVIRKGNDCPIVNIENTLPEYTEDVAPIYVNCIINLKNVIIPELGLYNVGLLIDDKELGTTQLLMTVKA